MKKKMLKKVLLSALIIPVLLTGCMETTTVNVIVDDDSNLNGIIFGKEALIKIGDCLYYDSTTRIVYWWNGLLSKGYYGSTTPTPYYAPNGLPYRYNAETNTFEEIIDK